MGHLIQPLEGPRPLADAQNELIQAHRELVQAGRKAASLLAGLEAPAWGSAAKRVRSGPSGQPLNELINQCATVERLLDAMAWVLKQDPEATLLRCHPTTSSGPQAGEDNDLIVLVAGERWCFEVSDVVNTSADGNQKELKDLRSLGLVVAFGSVWQLADPLPQGRQFLVVSLEFADRLMRPSRHLLRTGQLRYTRHEHRGSTAVIEVHPNP
jgi:hypothetical protein